MRIGLATSTALHAGALAWGLFVLGAPAALETQPVESLPVDLVSPEEFAQLVSGASDAPKADAPAPNPTVAEPVDEAAEIVGDAKVDAPVDPAPVIKEVPVKQVEENTEPEPAPEAFEVADVPAPSSRPDRPSEPTTELATVAEPAVPVTEPPAPDERVAEATPAEPVVPEPASAEVDPVAEAIETAEAPEAVEPAPTETAEAKSEDAAEPVEEAPQFASLPNSGPKALFRPARPRKATTPERRNEEAAPARRADKGEESVVDDIAALLNREKASGGGAKRTVQPASLGADKTTGSKIAPSDLAWLKDRIIGCWSAPAGAQGVPDLKVSIRVRLAPDGRVEGRPEILEAGGGRIGKIVAEAMSRNVRVCGPYDKLPIETHADWSSVTLKFSSNELL